MSLAEVRAAVEGMRQSYVTGWEAEAAFQAWWDCARSDLPLLLEVAAAAAGIREDAERGMSHSYGEGYTYEQGRRDACAEILARLESSE